MSTSYSMNETGDVEDVIHKDNRIYVMINNTKYPVIGRVGMNHFTVDVSNSDVKINDEVKIDMSPILVSSKIRREYK